MSKATMSMYDNYIGGRWMRSASDGIIENRNPANSTDLIGVFPDSSADDALAAIASAKAAFQSWRLVPAPKRAEILFRAAQLLMERK
jgi:acyl-CoA reductase-like NAD-dependent aldehyde dehydrogenase